MDNTSNTNGNIVTENTDPIFCGKFKYLFSIKDGKAKRKTEKKLLSDVNLYAAQMKLSKYLQDNVSIYPEYEIESISQLPYSGILK